MTNRIPTIALVLSTLIASATMGAAEGQAKAAPAADQAKITRAAAERMALERVPGGKIQKGELEREHGLLVWSIDISQPDSKNITEVQIDAISGKFVSIAVETPAVQVKKK